MANGRLTRLQVVAGLAIAGQGLHFLEERHGRFYEAFPTRLGLEPWSARFFVAFNVTWLAIWIAALAAARTRSRLVLLPLWFLGLASIVNGVAHPLLALSVGGYFPGLYTSPLVFLLGAALCRELVRVSDRAG